MKKCLLFLILFLASSTVLAEELEISTPLVKFVAKQGSDAQSSVSIINSGPEQTVLIESSGKNTITVDKDSIFLAPQESSTFTILFDTNKVGVFSDLIFINGISSYKLPVILEVESPDISVDTTTTIVPRSFKLSPGYDLSVEIGIYNLDVGIKQTNLRYYIADFQGNILASSEQTTNVDNDLQVTKSFKIPEGTSPGNYLFYVEAETDGLISTSTSVFAVSLEEKSNSAFYILTAVTLLVVIFFFIFNYLWRRKLVRFSKDWQRELPQAKIKYPEIHKEIAKLEYQRRLLEDAHSKGYIKSNSYAGAKRKISQSLSKLKKRL